MALVIPWYGPTFAQRFKNTSRNLAPFLSRTLPSYLLAPEALCKGHHHKNSYRIGRADQLTRARSIDRFLPLRFMSYCRKRDKEEDEAGSWQIGPHLSPILMQHPRWIPLKLIIFSTMSIRLLSSKVLFQTGSFRMNSSY